MQLKNGFHLMTTSTHLLPSVPQHNNNQPFNNVNLAVTEVQVNSNSDDDDADELQIPIADNNSVLYSLYDDDESQNQQQQNNGVNIIDSQLPRPSENLKFVANEYGFLELLDEHDDYNDDDNSLSEDDDDDSSSSCSSSSTPSPASKNNNKPHSKYSLDEDQNPQTICSCVTCGCYGLESEFYDTKHCTHDCSVITRINERKIKRELEEKEEEAAQEEEEEECEEEGDEVEDDEEDEDENSISEQPHCKRIKLEIVKEEADDEIAENNSKKILIDNPFRVNDLLEAIDPQHQSLFCPVTVVEVLGFRLLLKFIGYSDKYNFWVNADSKYIFPVRWSARYNSSSSTLTPPPPSSTSSQQQLHFHAPQNFSWESHIENNAGTCRVAPDSNFPHIVSILNTCSVSSPVRVGMKVEAVDRRNKNLICVATVSCVLGDRFLIHFDSWDSLYDYWTFIGSGDVFYCGYCKDNKIEITPPHCYENASEFDWDEYLKKTNSIAMPRDLMKHSVQSSYSVGDRVEVIDKRSPRLLRIASITQITPTTQTLSIHFPGLKSHVYDYDLHAFSENIHPLGWGASTGHPLADEEDEESSTSPSQQQHPHQRSPSPDNNFPTCPNHKICKSMCNVRGPNFPFHSKIRDCPYSSSNMQEYSESGKFTDRVVVFEDAHYDLGGGGAGSGEKHEQPMKAEEKNDVEHEVEVKAEKDEVKVEKKPNVVVAVKAIQFPIHRSTSNNNTMSMSKASNPINFNNLTSGGCGSGGGSSSSSKIVNGGKDPDIPKRSEILSWSHERISGLVQSLCSNLPTAQKVADQFRSNLIDGESFLMLTQSDMTEALGIKLGPAVKIYNLIRLIDLNK